MSKFSVVSTDSHVIIPPDELAARLPKRFRKQAGSDDLTEDLASEPMKKMRLVAERAKAKMNEEDLERSRAGGWDPELRLADQDRDGVSAEIMFGPLFFDIPLPEMARRRCAY